MEDGDHCPNLKKHTLVPFHMFIFPNFQIPIFSDFSNFSNFRFFMIVTYVDVNPYVPQLGLGRG